MSRSDGKAKRWRMWRPRFSVRTLVIFVTLVCAYFGAWEATKRYGLRHPLRDYPFLTGTGGGQGKTEVQISFGFVRGEDHSPGPLIISRDEDKRRYYLWLFGPIFKLPFETSSSGGFEINAQVTKVLAENRFEAIYLGSDDGVRSGDRVTVMRRSDHVCRGMVTSVTPDAAIVQKTGWGSWRDLKIGDDVQCFPQLP